MEEESEHSSDMPIAEQGAPVSTIGPSAVGSVDAGMAAERVLSDITGPSWGDLGSASVDRGMMV